MISVNARLPGKLARAGVCFGKIYVAAEAPNQPGRRANHRLNFVSMPEMSQ
jgi:hypothetical protein